tara:strand:+ start:1160 stop:1951 length:792 start_codon:yes stop_codon:yes gene_type:complete
MIGTVQGRLTSAPKNRLQFFPKNWRKEFYKAKKAKINYIEFFTERKKNYKNPIWSDDLIKEYKYLTKKNNLKIYSFVDDYIISNKFYLSYTQKYLKTLIKQISKLKIKYLVLPLYGRSNINNSNIRKFIKPFLSILNFAKKNKIKILLEANFTFNFYQNLIKKLKFPDLNIVFDTGNRINLNSDIYLDLLLFKKYIKHIHIKDKNSKNKNVKLNTGKVNFKKISKILRKINYKGSYTIESVRGRSPVKTLNEYKRYLNKIGIN